MLRAEPGGFDGFLLDYFAARALTGTPGDRFDSVGFRALWKLSPEPLRTIRVRELPQADQDVFVLVCWEELSYAADLIQSRNFRSFEAFIVIGVIYLLLSVALRHGLNWVAARFLFGRG